MEQEISPKDRLEKSIKEALTGASARNTVGSPCVCEGVTDDITITFVLSEKSDESNIDQWTEVGGTTNANIKIAQGISEKNITIGFTVFTENCEVVIVKSILA